jgi:D-3-phosphoglycerate dehydrogenase / 2-oxoglutarate reductase
MAHPVVVVSVPIEFRGRQPARQMLEAAGCQVIGAPNPMGSEAQVREALVGVHGFLAGMERVTAATLTRADQLRVIARNGVGFDTIDLEACTARGVVVTNTAGALSDAVAEEAMGLMLALTRHITVGDRTVKAGGYDVPMGEDLAAMTLGVIGVGNIGGEVVRRAVAFKMKVLANDPYVATERITRLGGVPVTLDQLLPAADIVTLHVPLTDQTRSMVNAGFLARMKPGALLVNTARGSVVDEAALWAALQDGRLAGAGLDVQVNEPATGRSRQLLELDNVVGMPHAGSKTLSTRERMASWAAASIVDVLQGRQPEHVVNEAVLSQLALRPR